MKKLSFIFLLLISACALRTPQSLQEQKPDFEYKGQNSNFIGVTECIFKKVDKFPIVFQLFDFEDRTIRAQIRQLSDNAEIYQNVDDFTISLIRLDKTSATDITAKLYTGNSITNDRVKASYPKIITDCLEEQGSK